MVDEVGQQAPFARPPEFAYVDATERKVCLDCPAVPSEDGGEAGASPGSSP